MANLGDFGPRMLHERVQRCGYELFLIPSDERLRGLVATAGSHVELELMDAWSTIITRGNDWASQECAWSVIERYGEPVPGGCRIGPAVWRGPGSYPTRSFLWRRRDGNQKSRYFALIPGGLDAQLSAFDLSLLATLWQIENHMVPIHSAAVIFEQRVLLFAGASGAGKSTAARLSSVCGAQVLDEDQVLIGEPNEGVCEIHAWGYGSGCSTARVHGVYFLRKALSPRLTGVGQRATSRLLFRRHLDVVGIAQHPTALEVSFRCLSDVARHVPGYELEFDNSPSFMRLIAQTLS